MRYFAVEPVTVEGVIYTEGEELPEPVERAYAAWLRRGRVVAVLDSVGGGGAVSGLVDIGYHDSVTSTGITDPTKGTRFLATADYQVTAARFKATSFADARTFRGMVLEIDDSLVVQAVLTTEDVAGDGTDEIEFVFSTPADLVVGKRYACVVYDTTDANIESLNKDNFNTNFGFPTPGVGSNLLRAVHFSSEPSATDTLSQAGSVVYALRMDTLV